MNDTRFVGNSLTAQFVEVEVERNQSRQMAEFPRDWTFEWRPSTTSSKWFEMKSNQCGTPNPLSGTGLNPQISCHTASIGHIRNTDGFPNAMYIPPDSSPHR